MNFYNYMIKALGEKPRPPQLSRHRLCGGWDFRCMCWTIRSRLEDTG